MVVLPEPDTPVTTVSRPFGISTSRGFTVWILSLIHISTHKQRKSDEMTRQELFTWVRQQYGTEPEYPWHDRTAVLRHNDNNKWYGVVLEVSADKLGLPEAGIMRCV